MATKYFPVWLSGHSHLLTFMTKTEYRWRRKDIRINKPAEEQAIRLYLMRRVKAKLPITITKAYAACAKADAAWIEAGAAWIEARAAWIKTDAELVEARAAWIEARAAWIKTDAELVEADAELVEADAAWIKSIQDNLPAIEALHRQEVPDTTWDGTTIFSEGWKDHPKAGLK